MSAGLATSAAHSWSAPGRPNRKPYFPKRRADIHIRVGDDGRNHRPPVVTVILGSEAAIQLIIFTLYEAPLQSDDALPIRRRRAKRGASKSDRVTNLDRAEWQPLRAR